MVILSVRDAQFALLISLVAAFRPGLRPEGMAPSGQFA